MTFYLKPLIGTETIKFGMSSNEIQSILKITPTKHKHVYSKYEYENYRGVCNVYYEPADNGEMIAAAFQFFEFSPVYLDDINLIGQEESYIKKVFVEKFSDCVCSPSLIESFQNRIVVDINCEEKTNGVFIGIQEYDATMDETYKPLSNEEAIAILRKQASL